MPAFVIRARDGGAVLAAGSRAQGVRLMRAGDGLEASAASSYFSIEHPPCSEDQWVVIKAASGAYLSAQPEPCGDGGGGGDGAAAPSPTRLGLVPSARELARFTVQPQPDGSVHLRTATRGESLYVSWLSAPTGGRRRPCLAPAPPDATCAWVLEPAPVAPQPPVAAGARAVCSASPAHVAALPSVCLAEPLAAADAGWGRALVDAPVGAAAVSLRAVGAPAAAVSGAWRDDDSGGAATDGDSDVLRAPASCQWALVPVRGGRFALAARADGRFLSAHAQPGFTGAQPNELFPGGLHFRDGVGLVPLQRSWELWTLEPCAGHGHGGGGGGSGGSGGLVRLRSAQSHGCCLARLPGGGLGLRDPGGDALLLDDDAVEEEGGGGVSPDAWSLVGFACYAPLLGVLAAAEEEASLEVVTTATAAATTTTSTGRRTAAPGPPHAAGGGAQPRDGDDEWLLVAPPGAGAAAHVRGSRTEGGARGAGAMVVAPSDPARHGSGGLSAAAPRPTQQQQQPWAALCAQLHQALHSSCDGSTRVAAQLRGHALPLLQPRSCAALTPTDEAVAGTTTTTTITPSFGLAARVSPTPVTEATADTWVLQRWRQSTPLPRGASSAAAATCAPLAARGAAHEPPHPASAAAAAAARRHQQPPPLLLQLASFMGGQVALRAWQAFVRGDPPPLLPCVVGGWGGGGGGGAAPSGGGSGSGHPPLFVLSAGKHSATLRSARVASTAAAAGMRTACMSQTLPPPQSSSGRLLGSPPAGARVAARDV